MVLSAFAVTGIVNDSDARVIEETTNDAPYYDDWEPLYSYDDNSYDASDDNGHGFFDNLKIWFMEKLEALINWFKNLVQPYLAL